MAAPTLTNAKVLAATSVASTSKLGGGVVISKRGGGANGVGDNQMLQTIADAFARGDVSETTINS